METTAKRMRFAQVGISRKLVQNVRINSILLIASIYLNLYASVIYVYSLNAIIYYLKCFEYILSFLFSKSSVYFPLVIRKLEKLYYVQPFQLYSFPLKAFFYGLFKYFLFNFENVERLQFVEYKTTVTPKNESIFIFNVSIHRYSPLFRILLKYYYLAQGHRNLESIDFERVIELKNAG